MNIPFLLVIATAATMFCPRFQCSQQIVKGVCNTLIQNPDGNITFNLGDICNNEISYCNYSYQFNYDDHCVPFNNLLPGEFCTSNSQCKSNVCDICHNTCNGKQINDACATHSDCDIGLFCAANNTCQMWKALGQSCGTNGDECASYLICEQNQCIVPGSIAVGQPAFNPFACSTLFTIEATPGNFVCATGPALNDSQTCPASGNCKYNLTLQNGTNSVITESCQCGYTKNGAAYCQHGVGDMASQVGYV